MSEDIANSRVQEMLFREVHHRFFNSLQVISASAGLLTRRDAAPDALRRFQERIAVLGELHRLLFDAIDDEACVSTALTRICAGLAAGFGRADTAFHIGIDAMPARPLAARVVLLAVVELVTNAFKHGDPALPLSIAIVAGHAGGVFRLIVASNTLPARGAAVRRPRIVCEMVEALGGEVVLWCEREFEVEVRLPG